VKEGMKFIQVEVWLFAAPEINEDLFVVMKAPKSVVHFGNGCLRVYGERCILNKVHHGRRHPDYAWITSIDYTNKHLLHVLVLSAVCLQESQDCAEVSDTGVVWKGSVMNVQFAFRQNLLTPLEEVILEDSAMNLVEEVQRDASKNIGMGKTSPKWNANRIKTICLKRRSGLVLEDMQVKIVRRAAMTLVFTWRIVSTMIGIDLSLVTSTGFATHNEVLLQVVCNVCGQDRKAESSKSICACNHSTCVSCHLHRLQYMTHASMEDIGKDIRLR
jgi:hypothetical protein